MGSQEVEYLGYRVGQHGVRPDPRKVEAIVNMPEPALSKELLVSFLCKMGYHIQFIHNFQEHTKVLRQLLKEKKYIWTDVHSKAFAYLKSKLTEAPVLTFFDPKKKTVIAADASGYAIGGVIKQLEIDDEGNEFYRPIAYHSRVLNPAERNYHTTERECLAIIEAIKKFYPYIHGRFFLIETDHCALKYLKSIRMRNPRLTRWACLLSELQFDIVHVKGVLHSEADCLSRLPNFRADLKIDSREDALEPIPRFLREYEVNALTLTIDARVNAISLWGPGFDENNSRKERDNLRIAQESDEYCISIRQSNKLKQFNSVDDLEDIRFAEVDGILARITVTKTHSSYAYVLPKAMIKDVVSAFHDKHGHSGTNATHETIKTHFWFPTMRETIRDFIRSCASCAKRKPLHLPKVMSSDYEDFVPDATEPPFSYCSLDLITMPPTGPRGYNYILCIICKSVEIKKDQLIAIGVPIVQEIALKDTVRVSPSDENN